MRTVGGVTSADLTGNVYALPTGPLGNRTASRSNGRELLRSRRPTRRADGRPGQLIKGHQKIFGGAWKRWYPFIPSTEQEFIIAHLLAADIIALKAYLAIRDEYIARNPYL